MEPSEEARSRTSEWYAWAILAWTLGVLMLYGIRMADARGDRLADAWRLVSSWRPW
jgi:hypothetical protein